jgi:TPR repeat protein
LRGRLGEARALTEPAERSARLFFLGRALCDSRADGAIADGRSAFLEAAALGNPWAAHDAAVLMLRGDGGPAEPERAIDLLREAAGAGLLPARTLLGRILATDPASSAEALSLLREAGGEGDPEALHLYGLLLFRGQGTVADPAAARDAQRRAADAGWADAMFEYALMLRLGLGGPADADAADDWERRAANVGQPRACLNLGARAVQGTPARLDDARRWYERAVDGGSAEAAARLCRMFVRGDLGVADRDRAFEWFERARALGYRWPEASGSGGGDG